MNFEFATTPLIVFGPGTLARLGEQAARLGRRAYLVTGGQGLERAGIIERVEKLLAERGVGTVRRAVVGEPDTRLCDDGARAARQADCDLVIGLGGGSPMDAAKAIACLMANGGECLDYMEVIGRGKPIAKPSVPLIAVPTTGGTGSETTHNAVLADARTRMKASLRHDHLFPRVAVVDSALSHSVPPEVTASTGLDALTQLIEPYVSRRAHPMIAPLALDGIRRAARALPRAYADGGDAEAREQMMLVAMWSGLALAHCGLGAAHGIAGPLGGSYPVPHGMACAALLPHVMEVNLRVAGRDPNGPEAIRRHAEVALALGAEPGAGEAQTARRGVEIVRGLCERMKVPPLGRFGVAREAIGDLAARSRLTSSMKANPVDLADEDLAEILERAIG